MGPHHSGHGSTLSHRHHPLLQGSRQEGACGVGGLERVSERFSVIMVLFGGCLKAFGL